MSVTVFRLKQYGVEYGSTSEISAYPQSCDAQGRPQKYRQDDGPEGEFVAEKIIA